MNILVSSMGKQLEIGATIVESLKTRVTLNKIGFLVANSKFFKKYNATSSFIEDNNVALLKEWEYTLISPGRSPDLDRIAKYENTIGDPTFWNAIMADRRIFFGEYCKSKQHYSPRYSYEELMIILDQALCQIDDFFQSLSPDLVLSFGTSIMGDYLIYLFAKSHGVPYLQLKATKIKNYVALHDNPCGLSTHIATQYFNDNFKVSSYIMEEAHSYLQEVNEKGLKYEGAILSSRSRMAKRLMQGPMNQMKSLWVMMKDMLDPVIKRDCHIPGNFRTGLHTNFFQPVKAYTFEKKIKKHKKYLDGSDLNKIGSFIFFPLHFEPEVSIQVFGRSYQNQIELIRNIALSASVGIKVVVKEHPRSLGFRTFTYYRKLLEIPNVYLIDPFVKAHHVVAYAQMVAVITGSIGLEAAIKGIPVITFGQAAYNILPDSMVRHVKDLNTLSFQINDLLSNYSHNSEALVKYVAAFIKGSTPVDLYSVLLNKGGRYFENQDNLTKEERRKTGYEHLIDYCMQRFQEEGIQPGGK